MPGITRDTIVDERYRVLRRIGSGGMADVYVAEDMQLGRRVALKLLYRRFAEDDEFVERFRREASAAAGLQHPHVVQVFDRGEWDGTYYIAMEYLEGRSLKQVIREEGPLDPDRAIEIVVQVLRAERFAHKRGIVHRDIKPHNVIVDDEGRAKVTDFGIARAGASDMTETGSILGTAQYLSPEQAQGHAVSARADIYSTGIVLYEMLTGRVPFDGESAVTIALKQVTEEPIPPSRLSPAVPPALEDAVLRAMAKDPAHRFADADEFIGALLAVREHPGMPAGATRIVTGTGGYPVVPPYPPADLERADRRNLRRLLWLVLALALLAIGIGAFLLLQPKQAVVPDVVGRRSATAAQILQNAGFEVDIQTVRNDEVPRDRVATQKPQPGEEAREGSTVTIIVSSGPGEVAIPFVEGQTQRQATAALRRAGFKVDVRTKTSDEVPAGRVIETSPPQNSLYERGQTVALVVSSGPQQATVPDVVGRDREAAVRLLEERALRVDFTERETAAADPGAVLEQRPAAGAQVNRGSSVTLVLAKEPAQAEVPAVTDLEVEEALAALEEAGFRPRQREREVDVPEQDRIVVDQDPKPGERRKKGSRVTVVVGSFTPAPSPTPTPTPTPTPAPVP